MSSNAEVARAYIQAIESGASGDALTRFFTADVVIQEMPNRIAPSGSVSDLAKALQGAERGKHIFSRQTYSITTLLAEGNRVALELDWRGITAIPIQNLSAGSEMRDHAAIFLEFRDGRIAHQRHYDCFEPW
jgi:ketosteroid isomerase-like protein